ncbi:hypothetical protein [Candidatus Ichthyocystis hellenicum]|nr:hypothetical protein [Candidatus Ichthyocystis hellenicum]
MLCFSMVITDNKSIVVAVLRVSIMVFSKQLLVVASWLDWGQFYMQPYGS